MTAIRPYGDVTDDGMVQLSFTLPIAASERGRQAAIEMTRSMGLEKIQVTHMKPIGEGFTVFILYASYPGPVNPDALEVPARDFPVLSYQEINRTIREHLKRRLVVVGACTGSDAHTVGLDAILSMKGYAGDKGLEYFPELHVVNLGAQVDPADILDVVRREKADAVLISQVVTQRDAHIHHLERVRATLEEAGERDNVILVGGGPRLAPEQAVELGYDRIFGRGTKPSEVAAYLAWAVTARKSA